MGKAKKGASDKEYNLTEREYNYLQILNLALTYNVFKDKAISGFLYYVASNRLGYGEDVNLVFEVDLDETNNPKRVIKIKEIPAEAIAQGLRQANQE